jgi:hypothetical protein
LLQSRCRGIVDNSILAALKNCANVQCKSKQGPLQIICVILQQRRQRLKNLELDIKPSRCSFPKCLKNLWELQSWKSPCNNESLQANDGYAGEFDILGAASYEKWGYEVGSLCEI